MAPALDHARDHYEACAAVVGQLVVHEGLLPNIYLQRGGRLRCVAVAGFRQIVDGMPLHAGLVGRAFRSGRPVVVNDVRATADYIEVMRNVVAEICVPVRADGCVVGVVSCESTKPLDDTVVQDVERWTERLGLQLEALGGALPESTAQRLARQVELVSGLTSVPEIEAAIVVAACEVANMCSAAVVALSGECTVRAAIGGLEMLLPTLPADALEALYELVASGSSCYTVGAGGEEDFEALGQLREHGFANLILVPLHGTAHRRVLVVGDAVEVKRRTDIVEVLETLSAQAASALRGAELVRELNLLASTDGLTGLGHQRTLHARLEGLKSARVALLIFDVDHFKQINDSRGHAVGDEILKAIATVRRTVLREPDELFRIGGDEFAAVLHIRDEDNAVRVADRLCETIREQVGVTLSAGVSLWASDEEAAEALKRADEALYAVKRRGRNGVAAATAISL